MKPVWLLDIDGVLNYFPSTKPAGAKTDKAVLPGYGMFQFTYNQSIIDYINSVCCYEADVRWATTWVSQIHEPERIFGITAPLAFDTMSWVLLPLRSAMKPTPQASCSKAGS